MRGTQVLESAGDLPECSYTILMFGALNTKKEICCCHHQKYHGAGSGTVETLGYLQPGLHACNHSSIRIPSLVSVNSTQATALSQVLFSASVLGLETVSGFTWGPMWKIKLQYQAQNLVSFYDILLTFFYSA